jgi:hypothetical protein
MKVYDQRVVEPVFAHVVEAVGSEARQDSRPDQRCEKKKCVSIRAGPRGETLESYCCYFGFPGSTKIELDFGEVSRANWKNSGF